MTSRRIGVIRSLYQALSDVLHGRVRMDSNLVFSVAGNLIGAVISLFFWLIITSLLETTDYGIFNYVTSVSTVVSASFIVGTNTVLTTFLAKGNEAVRNPVKSLLLVMTAPAMAIGFTITGSYEVLLLVPAFGFFELTLAELLGEKSYKKYSIILILQRSTRAGISIVLFLLIQQLDSLILGFALGSILFSVFLFKRFRFSNPFTGLQGKWNFMLHSHAMYLVQELGLISDKLLIMPLFGFQILGLYQFANQVLLFASIIPTALYSYLLPMEASGGNRSFLRLSGIGVSCIVAAVIVLVSPMAISAIFPKFVESILAVQIAGLGIIPMTISYMVNSHLIGKNNTRPVFIGAIIFSGVQYLLIYILGTMFSVTGLAIATLSALSTQSLFLAVTFKVSK